MKDFLLTIIALATICIMLLLIKVIGNQQESLKHTTHLYNLFQSIETIDEAALVDDK